MNVVEFLWRSSARFGRRSAVTDVRSDRSLTYRALAQQADVVAAFLRAQGVHPGQRIGLLAPNGLAYLPAAFGLLAAEACLVPLAPTLTSTELTRILDAVDVNGCLCWPGAAPLPGAERQTVLDSGECDGFTFRWVNRDASGPAGLERLNAAFIRFTSGTTADSKGVVLSHEATSARVEAADQVIRLGAEDRILWVLPLAYHFAVTIVAYVRAGSHILMCPDTLPAGLVDSARRLGATLLYASPLHFERMANLTPGAPLRSVRLALSTSAPIATAVIDRFESQYGVALGQAYGLIEAGLPCINRRADGVPAASVGRPVPGYEVAVFADSGAHLPAGASGEVAVRGAGLFSAYYVPWRLRDRVTRHGWFFTGDLGWLDQSGALYLEGRKTAAIFVAGLKVFPEEVEECINRYPGVRESRVFAGAHPHLGEVPVAEVVLESVGGDLAGLREHCVQALSTYKVPVEFRVIERIPRTPGGKVLRRPRTL